MAGDELGEDGKRKCTVAQIATEFGVTRPSTRTGWNHPISAGQELKRWIFREMYRNGDERTRRRLRRMVA